LERKLLEINTPLSNFLYDITRVGAEFDRRGGYDGLIINDPLTIAYLIDRNMLEFINRDVVIDEKSGKSIINDTNYYDDLVAVSVETNKFYKMLFKIIFDYDL
jgi:inosine-uridine nucleoside N-ribohydrolase